MKTLILALALVGCTQADDTGSYASTPELVEEVYSCEEWHSSGDEATGYVEYSGDAFHEHAKYPLSINVWRLSQAEGDDGDDFWSASSYEMRYWNQNDPDSIGYLIPRFFDVEWWTTGSTRCDSEEGLGFGMLTVSYWQL